MTRVVNLQHEHSTLRNLVERYGVSFLTSKKIVELHEKAQNNLAKNKNLINTSNSWPRHQLQSGITIFENIK